MDELSTLSYSYGSLSSSGDSDLERTEIDESACEEVYAQDGKCDPDAEAVEDRKLENWHRWMEDRKRLHGRLKSTINRECEDSVMHSYGLLEKRRNADLIEYARKYTTFDKYRGDPKFWKTPNYIYDHCDKEVVINCPVRDKYDRNEEVYNDPPGLEYIGVPRLESWEPVEPEAKALKKSSHKCDYFNQRKVELQDNVRLIENYVPEVDNLYVIGKSVGYEDLIKSVDDMDISADFPIVIESARGPDERKRIYEDTRFPNLKIKDKVVNKTEMKKMQGDLELVVRFTDCQANQMYSETLTVENIGNVCVRYTWRQVEPYRNSEIPLQYSTQLVKRFFFPTKSNIFLPGQITEIPFLFKSREPGVYQETWKLVPDPVFSKDKSIKFSLQGFVRAVSTRDELSVLEKYIEKCHVTSFSIALVDSVAVDYRLQKPIPYESHFLYKDVFSHNNPDHFYEFETVEKLYELHRKIRNDAKWDLSIVTLRNNILSHGSLDDQRANLQTLYELSKTLLKKNMDLDIDREKYRAVYQLLCTFFNTFEQDAVQLRSTYRIREFTGSLLSLATIKERLSAIAETKPRPKSGARASRMSSGRNKSRSSSAAKKLSKTPSVMTQNESISMTAETISEFIPDLVQDKLTAQYVKTLSIKVRQHLSTCVDEITAVIDTLNMFIKPK